MTHWQGFAFCTPTPDSVGSEVLAIEEMSPQGYSVMSPLKFQVPRDIGWTRMKVSFLLCEAIDSASQAVAGMRMDNRQSGSGWTEMLLGNWRGHPIPASAFAGYNEEKAGKTK